MSDKRKEQRPLNPELPGEDGLSRLYREGSNELPSAKLDAAILDAARQAVHSRPRRVYVFPSRKWVVPLSLAAALWVTLEIVMLQRSEITDQHLNAPVAPAPQSQSSEAMPQRMDEATAKASPLSLAPAPAERGMLTLRRPQELQPEESARERESEREALETRTARGIRLAPATPHPPTAKPPTNQMPQDSREKAAKALDSAVAGLQADTTSAQPTPPASHEQEKPIVELAAPTEAPAFLSDAPPAAGATLAEARKESELSPKEWLAKIKELRRAGKRAEAEASLQEFRKRYPEYPVEKP